MFKSLILSDIHLGHDTNKTEDIIFNLRRFFKKYKSIIIKQDAIIISGDIYDKLLSSVSYDNIIINKWLTELVLFCKDYGIKLRILEGTPGHDWKQVKNIFNIINDLNIDIDIKYFEELDIEYMEDKGIYILYVPDEWKPTSKEILTDVHRKLLEYKIDKVDIAIMHGAFSYQLPVKLEDTLEPEDYLKIVKGPIVIGHVHNRSYYKRIVVPGSFDALTHSDDDLVKGGLLITYDKNKFTFKYLDNDNALTFKTFILKDNDIREVDDILKKLPKDKKLNIRFKITSDINLNSNLLELKSKYPNIKIKFEKNKKDKEKVDEPKTFIKKRINLDKKEILNYVNDRISNDTDIDAEIVLKELYKVLND